MTNQDTAPNERSKRIQARKARIAALTPRIPRVRVVPATDEFRRALRHPLSGMKFPESGSAEWPLDTFTKRRLKDGCVTLEGGGGLKEALEAGRISTLPARPGVDNTLPAEPAARAARRSQADERRE